MPGRSPGSVRENTDSDISDMESAVSRSLPSRARLEKGGRHLLLALALAPFAAAAADPSEPPLPVGARLVFEDDFSAADLEGRWTPRGAGSWEVRDGALFGRDNGIIFCDRDIGPDVRVEYDAWSSDPPCDLSVLVSGDPARREKLGGYWTPSYFFGVGAFNNSKHAITRNGVEIDRTLMEGFTGSLVQGQHHHIVAQRQGSRLELFIDGRRQLDHDDLFPLEKPGRHVGLYTWTSGFFDNVKIYALPTVPEPPPELPTTVADHEGFDAESRGSETGTRSETGTPGTLEKSLAGEASATVVDEPNWAYRDEAEEWITDRCLRVTRGSGKSDRAEVSRRFPELDSGILECDILARQRGEGFRVSLRTTAGDEAAAIFVDRDGVFHAAGGDGPVRLRETIEYRRRSAPAPFRFEAGRWYTLRMTFDRTAGVVRDIAVVGMYTETKIANFSRGSFDQGDYHRLGRGLPLLGRPGPIAQAALSIGAGGDYCLDNLHVIGPIGKSRVNGEAIIRPARFLSGRDHPPRKDPIRLDLYSLKGLEPRAGDNPVAYAGRSYATVRNPRSPGGPAFREAGLAYGRLLVRQAFVAENRRLLDRAGWALENSGRLASALRASLRDAGAAADESLRLLERAYESFARAYIGGLDAASLDKEHGRAARELEAALGRAESLAAAWWRGLPADLVAGGAENPCPFPDPRPVVWKDGCWRAADGRPDFHYYNRDNPDRPEVIDLLGFPRRVKAMAALSAFAKEGEYIASAALDRLGQLPAQDMHVFLSTPSGVHGCSTDMPEWWHRQHSDDPDIFMADDTGKPLVPQEPKAVNGVLPGNSLNFWNANVREFNEKTYDALGRAAAASGRVTHVEFGREAGNSVKGGYETGHNPSAVTAFREFLRAEHGSLEKLNERWGTSHASFDEIVPPRRMAEPSGVQYDFQRFRQHGYRDWLAACRKAYQKHAPHVPALSDFQLPFGGEQVGSFDMPSFFEMGDIVAYHTYKIGDRSYANIWLDSLRKAHGNVLDNAEWGPAQTTREMFSEECYRRSGLAQLFHRMMWGQGASSMWVTRPSEGEWVYSQTSTEPRLGYLPLRYHASLVPVHQDRARRFGRPALEFPSIQPDVAIVEATASYYNGLPPFAVRHGMRAAAESLAAGGWNFGVLYEQLLLNKKQSLAGVQAAILPNAVCMPRELGDVLLNWVREGGTLVAFAPPGVMNQYGRPDGALLAEIFHQPQWKNVGLADWEPEGTLAPAETIGPVRLYRAACGKGQVWMFSSGNDFARLVPKTEAILADSIRRSYRSRHGRLDLCLRDAGSTKLLYALNSSLDDTLSDEILVRGVVTAAVDRGLVRPVKLPVGRDGEESVIPLRLAPGEGTLLELSGPGIAGR
jgi:hypothetical protein